MQKLIDDFNKVFEGTAKAEIVNDELEITIGSVTASIQLPSIVGSRSTGGEVTK